MNPEVWASLVTLTALEIVLGIDNLAFIAILAARLPPERQNSAWRLGLALAVSPLVALEKVGSEFSFGSRRSQFWVDLRQLDYSPPQDWGSV